MNNRRTLMVFLSDMFPGTSGREHPAMKCAVKGWKIYHYNDRPAIRRWLMADQNINMHYPNHTALILSQIIEENAP